jgi:hypothetical protein
MNYSPVLDILITGSEIVLLAAVALNYVLDAIFWRRCAEMFRRGGMWGGE